ncbi:SDR family NAD(P)-dependent oxidoreductase [Croceicoccus bisphenolivorans]|uniref:SDR family NAD(P)-dependent oxidoreductase n=1 Tax=Croceicoccus bisphenolivorans TaxID=1783232 RepID=UPI000832EC65|nr:SDR family oxidoreductase [Croceicoccus bisphenolivorans]
MSERRRAIVVGGAGGLGSEICRKLASEGHRVVIADFDLARAQALLPTLDGAGHVAVHIDVTKDELVDSVFEAEEANAPLGILVIASGGPVVHLGQAVNVATMAIADWERTLSLNLTGVFRCIQKFAQLRMASPVEDARIVIVGSAAGLVAGNGTDVAYSVSKAALFGLARQAAFELASAGITVNVVAPGPVGTEEFHRNTNEQIRAAIASKSVLNRLATPEEVAGGVMYLLSPAASYVTGATIDINGGIHMR